MEKKYRNCCCPEDPIAEAILLSQDKKLLSNTFSKFVAETRKTNVESYTPKTIIMIMCGLLRYMKTLNPNCPNFLDKKDNEFQSLHGAMDVVFHQLHTAGVGRDTKHVRNTLMNVESQFMMNVQYTIFISTIYSNSSKD